MFRHIVLLRWNESAPADVVEQMARHLAELHAAHPSLVDYRYGPDAALADDNWDYAVVADFASEADYIAFRDDPDHQSMVQQVIVPWRGERAATQFQLTGD